MNRTVLIIFTFLFAQALSAQVKISSSVDKREIRIGEPIQFSLETVYPANVPLQWFDLPDTFNTLEISKREKIDTVSVNGGFVLRQKLIVTGYDSGRWVIPPFTLILEGRTYQSDSFSITVIPVTLEGNDYKDLKEIEEADAIPAGNYIAWIIAGIALLLLAAWLLTRKKKKTGEVTGQPGSGYEEALKQLDQLKKAPVTEKGEVLQYYTRLTDIFRNYLQRDKGIRSRESTSLEILLELKKANIESSVLTETSIVLRRCDFVKFAKYLPSAGEHAESINTIEQTIKIIHQQP
jgi:LPXTG-motif cell wall-anchored protein